MRKSAFFTILLGGLVLFTGIAAAVERHVPSEYATIQAAINDCNNGDIVSVAPGTYTGTGNRDIDFLGKAITVSSINPDDPCVVAGTVIDCNGTAAAPHRGFYLHSSEGPNSIISGFTITNGYVRNDNGGGIATVGSSPTIEKCFILDNEARGNDGSGIGSNGSSVYGGGIYCSGSNTIIIKCVINGNTARGGSGSDGQSFPQCIDGGKGGNGCGGGIYGHSSSHLTIEDCNITNNLALAGTGGFGCNNGLSGAGHGGGIYGEVTVIDTVVTDNEADSFLSGYGGYGGGGYFIGNSSLINCLIASNHACCENSAGGGIYGSGDLYIANCGVMDNSSIMDWGGGMYLNNGSATAVNCIFSGNESGLEGGGIYSNSASATITACTITENRVRSSWGNGGGICAGASSIIKDSIIWENECATDPEIHGSPVVTYSDIEGGWPGTGNINADPCFAEPGYWDDNDTPTDLNDDFWVAGDYHLKSEAGRWEPGSQSWVKDAVTSPCIDAGNPGCPLGDEPGDANNVRINMGSYGGTAEASKTPAGWRSIADLTNDWAVDINDLGVFVSYWLDTGGCIPSDLDRNNDVNFVDYAILAREWPGALLAAGEPGVEYEISDCQMGLAAMLMNLTRFTITVKGRYVYFEDMMSANCCTPIQNLWIEMTVNGLLITVNENEELPQNPCYCICDYPITATLGPFEPGTYTLEVYNGGFVGSTTVVIE